MYNLEAAIEDAKTGSRMDLSVSELNYLHWEGSDTPVSGDALAVYGAEQ
ncbi:hypothetical protein HOV00_gp44 [Microbacterium phage Schubert]|uniref:Uncharacterized protein n=1 Tax=Microbacterium phage Schubert TaxID=2500787 RepID=A0A3Q9RAA5_9CAUD|nr:hypothetical protein HOV00_gp44 [Microbacterium phage Schubert]AZV01755.1 hypothetical protein SEA_SCHUBERT_49 [Microbacterium phage Schubert]